MHNNFISVNHISTLLQPVKTKRPLQNEFAIYVTNTHIWLIVRCLTHGGFPSFLSSFLSGLELETRFRLIHTISDCANRLVQERTTPLYRQEVFGSVVGSSSLALPVLGFADLVVLSSKPENCRDKCQESQGQGDLQPAI